MLDARLLHLCFAIVSVLVVCSEVYVQYINALELSMFVQTMSGPISEVLPVGDHVPTGQPIGVAIGGATIRSSSCERALTFKGLQVQIDQKLCDFRSSISAWRRRSNRIEHLLESVNTDEVKQERVSLENAMLELQKVYDEVDELLFKDNRPGAEYDRFEKIESEHHDLLKKVSKFIIELNSSRATSVASERKSGKSGSKCSSKSLLSCTSKRADSAAKAAALRIKLKYIDSEAKCKAELDKIQTQKELEKIESRSEAILKIEKEETYSDIDDKLPDERLDYVENYMESHNASEVLSGDNLTITNTDSSYAVNSMPFAPNHSHAVTSGKPIFDETLSKVPVSISMPLTSGLSHTSHHMSSHTQTLTSLNSHVSEFVPKMAHQTENEKLLDDKSDTTFVVDSTCEALGVQKTQTKLALPTISAKNQVNSFKPTTGQLMPIKELEVGLLIEYSCPRALVQREVIPSIKDEPCGQRTDLGWGIVGILKLNQTDVSDLDPIGLNHENLSYEEPPLIKSAPDLYHGKVQICLNTSVKGTVSPSQITQMMELELNERNSNKSYSQDDLRFLFNLKEGIHQNTAFIGDTECMFYQPKVNPELWACWRKKYLHNLQIRQKWGFPSRNL